MKNPNQLNYTQQLEHRIAMIQDDLKALIDFIDENRLMEALEKKSNLAPCGWTHICNMEIASDLSCDESLSWGKLNNSGVA